MASKFKVTFTLDESDASYFRNLYRRAKHGNPRQLLFALTSLALIGVILLGVRFLGWTW